MPCCALRIVILHRYVILCVLNPDAVPGIPLDVEKYWASQIIRKVMCQL